MTPRVSVIIPVYNAADYVGECLQSVLDQSIDPADVEIVVVDDGSTDGSEAILAEFAARDPRMILERQENSGSPGGARNPALDRAGGEFVFFLDADDLLAPEALRRMVEVATSEGSDVVLGKMAGLGGRKVPTRMFHHTQLDAPLVESKVFYTLGPTKLIRRSLIEELGLRFPVDQKVGEDQPFMAAAYINARKISILADQDYYFARRRDDGGNITRTVQSSQDHLRRALQLTEIIEQYTDPGRTRDGLLKRPFAWAISKGLRTSWMREEPATQEDFVAQVRERLGHLYSEPLRASLTVPDRITLDLVMAGEVEVLRTFLTHLRGVKELAREWGGDGFLAHVPAEVAAHLSEEQRAIAPPTLDCRLEELSVEGATTVLAGTLERGLLHGVPEAAQRVRRREDQETREFPVEVDDPAPAQGPLPFRGRIADLGRGTWDVELLVRCGSWEQRLALGARRLRSLDPEGTSNLGEDLPVADRVVAFYDPDDATLVLDRGAGDRGDRPGAEVLGLTLDENARCVALVRTAGLRRGEDEFFADLRGVRRHGGRHLLPTTRLGEGLHAVRLPCAPELIGARLELSLVREGTRAPLPIRGAEYWPPFAAGYGLVPASSGGVRIVAPEEQPAPAAAAAAPSGAGGLRARVRAIPVLGSGLARARRVLRGR